MKKEHALGAVQTYEHIAEVRGNINTVIKDLIDRGHVHDRSKLESPEVEIFGKAVDMKDIAYGSPEYKQMLEDLRPAISHHHSKNRHHTEFWPNGVNDMTLMDLIEMLCDWKAATKRNKDGNIRKSIEYNCEQKEISPQLRKILENTVRELFND